MTHSVPRLCATWLAVCVCVAVTLGLPSDDIMATYDTIVVGLGSAGVTAATTLARAGQRVLGLEAQARIGGRVYTVPFGDGIVEMGAEWIHGQHLSRVYDAAMNNNVSVLPQEFNFATYRSDGSLADNNLIMELTLFCTSVAESGPFGPGRVGDLITNRLMDYIKEKHPNLLNDQDFISEFLQYMNLLVDNYEASDDWNDISTASIYEELDGHQHMSWHRYGYKTFFEIMLNKFNNGPGLSNLDTQLSTEVTQIIWSQDPQAPVSVSTKDGTVYKAKQVIVTVSVGVLKERHQTLFLPQLPQYKIDAIERIPIGTIDKVILSFSEPWWPMEADAFAFIWKGEDKKKVSKDDYWTTRIYGASRPMGSNNTLTLWTSGEVAKLVENLPEDIVKRKSMELLRKFMGSHIPEPTGMIRSTWYSNPFTRGSYTHDDHILMQHPESRGALARPLLDSAGSPRVLFAGEATNDVHFSTVHGASETGYREAMRLLPTSKL